MKNKDIYMNNNTGKKYIVDELAIDCTNDRDGTRCVVYHVHDFSLGRNMYFVRELEEFKAKFTLHKES